MPSSIGIPSDNSHLPRSPKNVTSCAGSSRAARAIHEVSLSPSFCTTPTSAGSPVPISHLYALIMNDLSCSIIIGMRGSIQPTSALARLLTAFSHIGKPVFFIQLPAETMNSPRAATTIGKPVLIFSARKSMPPPRPPVLSASEKPVSSGST